MQRAGFWNRSRVRRGLRVLTLAAALPLAGCNVDEILDVTDPDIINPEDVATATGAEGLRIGALARFIGATSGDAGADTFFETMFVWSGMLADEWRTGDTFAQRLQVDSRSIEFSNSGVNDAIRKLHRARLASEQAVLALRQYAPATATTSAQIAELYFAQAYVENMMAEYLCNGIAISTVMNGVERYGPQLTTAAVYDRALAHADSALASGPTNRVRDAARVLRGRILVNQGKFADAAAAVSGVATTFAYSNQHSQTTRDNVNWAANNNSRRYTVANNEGTNGLNFATANDPRLPVCLGGSTACRNAGFTQSRPFNTLTPTPLYIQLKWPNRADSMAIADGLEARLIEAEAALDKGASGAYLPILNALRATRTGLAPLTDPGTAAGRVDQLMRERAFWMFGTGHRLGDLRRLVRQYGRPQESVFPVGNFAEGGTYGSDVNFPITQAEQNNPEVTSSGSQNLCFDRNA
jgi:tetratricopeptide (TPR) repeat protein